jgi:predicted TIM-barrel fold metal-dependent hydrolase
VEVIDAHTHLYYPGERFEDCYSLWDTFEKRVGVLREAGVTRALASRNESVEGRSYEELLGWNRRIADACRASEGLYFPSAIVQPDDERACEVLRHCREDLGMRFVGEMFAHDLGHRWGTPGYYRLLECAIELRMIPLIHCEDEVAGEIGERYPEGRFIIAHLRIPPGSYESRIQALAPFPDLYLDISGHGMFYSGLIRDALDGLGADRVLFGTDLGVVDPVLAVQCVRRSGRTEEEQRLIFAENFKRLWGWTDG